MSVRVSQVLLRHGPDNFFSENKLAKEIQADTSEFRSFRSIGSNTFKLTSVPDCLSKISCVNILKH